jgi:DNA-binding NarL/FixJ family response regulator
MSPVITVAVADDQALIRAGFTSILAAEDDIEIVGEASNGAEAVALVARTLPDIVLMDIRMPVMDGLEATHRIATDRRLARTSVIALTTFEVDEYVFGALRAGASAFLLKGIEPPDLVEAVRVVARGDGLLDPSVTRRLIEAYVESSNAPSGAGDALSSTLTDRETEILLLVSAGLTNVEIARELYISPLTTKSHVSNILMKLGARDRTQLVVMAYESGLVVPGRLRPSFGVVPAN